MDRPHGISKVAITHSGWILVRKKGGGSILSIGHSNVHISICLKRQKHQAKAPTIKQKTWAENTNLNPPGRHG